MDFNIEFQYPNDWNVTQKNVITTNYGIEQDITILFQISSPELYEWIWPNPNYIQSDTAHIGVGFYHDIPNMKQFTKIVKKDLITNEYSINKIN